jgi:hypothetical protein
MKKSPLIFYRYVTQWNHYDEAEVGLLTFDLIKETPGGYWIDTTAHFLKGKKKWVSKHSKKRYAYPTKAEAMVNFIKRKEKEEKIYRHRLIGAIDCLKIAKNMKV